MSPSKYVQEAVVCEEYVAKYLSKDYKLPRLADNPFQHGYCPELDVSPVLGPNEASCYESLTGVMRWIIKIGCININTGESLLSTHLAMPRQGLFEAALHIMGFLKLRHNSMFDPFHWDIDHCNFLDCN